MNTPLGPVSTETGICDCGRPCIVAYLGKEPVTVCDECREYFKGGFNVVIPEVGK